MAPLPDPPVVVSATVVPTALVSVVLAMTRVACAPRKLKLFVAVLLWA